MLKRIFTILLILTSAVSAAWAQYDVAFSHYWAMEPSFNPAAAGKNNKLNVTGVYALNFAGYENNPNSFYVGADLPLYFMKQYHGVGASILNDKIGFFTHQRISGQYAFRHALFGGMLAAGVQLGMIMEKYDGSKADLEQTDPAFPQSQLSGNSLDISFGLYYTYRNWYAGASVQHLNAPLVEMGEVKDFPIDRTYYLTGGYNIQLRNPLLSMPASVLVRYDGKAYRADVTARLVYTNEKKVLYAGLGYSPTNSVTAFVGGSFHGINLGYSYEMYTGTAGVGNGSHELIVSYSTDINLQKKGRNKHKSVRFL